MKKVLLAVMMVLFTVSLFAQSGRPTRMNYEQTKKFSVTEKFNPFVTEPSNTATPERSVSGVVNPQTYIGSSYVDNQSNYNQHNRVAVFADGTVSTVWTTAPRNMSDRRGTGYNHFDGSAWVNAYDNIARIEGERTGWGCIAPLGSNNQAEIVAAHANDDYLVISVRAQKGTGNWITSHLVGPQVFDTNGANPTTALVWPDIATNGNTIHLVACTEQTTGYLYQGIRCCLLYYRGTYNETDNTISWEQPRIVFDATPATYEYFTADRYSIAANGDNVAILYATPFTDINVWKSTDNGVNFTTVPVFDNVLVEEAADPSIIDTALQAVTTGGISTVAIDANGKVHVAFDLMRVKWANPDSLSYSYYPNWGAGLVYWNEDMAPFSGRYALDADTLVANGYAYFGILDLDGDDTARFYSFNYYADEYEGSAFASHPQIVTEGNNVYLIYNGMLEYPFLSSMSTSIYQLHGIFANRSTNGGQSWENGTSWLSYNKECFYVEDWDTFLTDTLNNHIYIDNDCTFPAVGQDVVNGKVHMYWMQDVYPDISGSLTNLSYVAYMGIDGNQIGVYNNTNEISQGLWLDPTSIADNTLEGMKLYPNPASDHLTVAISSAENASADVMVYNLMGQMMYSQNVVLHTGNNVLNVNISNLNAGVYMVTVRTQKGTSTQKLIVK